MVNGPLSIGTRQIGKRWGPRRAAGKGACQLQDHVHVTDRAAIAEAAELIARFGQYAASEAAQRADRSRAVGNVVHFCRWREIERAVGMLSANEVRGTVH